MSFLIQFTSFGSHFVFTMFVDVVLILAIVKKFVTKNIGVVLYTDIAAELCKQT